MHDDTLSTELIRAWSEGDPDALDRLIPIVYRQLHRIASNHLRRERHDHTLQSTALINEAFLALASSELSLNDRAHFFAVASGIMRRILVDHARSAKRQKRGGDLLQVTLHDHADVNVTNASTVLDLEMALSELEAIDARKARIVEMSYFGGLTYDEIAAVFGISPATVKRDLRFSKAWIRKELDNG